MLNAVPRPGGLQKTVPEFHFEDPKGILLRIQALCSVWWVCPSTAAWLLYLAEQNWEQAGAGTPLMSQHNACSDWSPKFTSHLHAVGTARGFKDGTWQPPRSFNAPACSGLSTTRRHQAGQRVARTGGTLRCTGLLLGPVQTCWSCSRSPCHTDVVLLLHTTPSSLYPRQEVPVVPVQLPLKCEEQQRTAVGTD